MRRARATTLIQVLIAAGVAGGGLGWQPASHAQGAGPGQAADTPRSYAIPPGPLNGALARFGAESGVALVGATQLVQGKTSPGLNGRYGVEQGFAALLTGTGLEAFRQANGSYGLRAVPQSSHETTLSPVTVLAASEAPTEGSGSFTTGSTSAATGLNLSLRETPQSMTVVTRERMDQQGLASLADVAEQVPGIFHTSTGTPIGGRTEIFSRGFAINSYQVDGVTVPWESMGESERYGQSALDTAIYDSITVVRGATGLLTGAGDPSGSISLTRKKPTRAFQGSVAATLGRWDRRRVMADVGAPINESGSVRGRLVGAYEEGKTWVEGYSNDRGIVYGVLEAGLGPRTLLTLALEHARDSSEGAPWAAAYGVPLFFADGTPTPANRGASMAPSWAYSNNDRTNLSATLEHRFDADWNARLSYGYGQFHLDGRRGMVTVIPADGSPTAARVLNLDYDYDVHSLDAKVEGKYALFGRKHDLVAGLNLSYTDQDLHNTVYAVVPGAAWWQDGRMQWAAPDWDALGKLPMRTRINQHGAYLATRLRPTDSLSLIVGGRLSYWKTHSAYLEPYSVSDDRRYSSEFTPYAGAVLDLTPSLSAYASYTEIFKPQNYKDVNGRLLDPEEGTNGEVGLKGEWFEGRLNASLALFETRKNNLAVRDGNNTTPQGDFAYRAEDSTKGRGWEIEVAGELAPGWQIQGGYTRFVARDSEGERLNTLYPAHQFKLFTSYRPAALPKLTVGGGVRWQSKIYDSASVGALREAYTIGSHAVVNLSARYELASNLTLAVNFYNALDKVYRTSYYDHSYGAPRNLTATLSYRF